MPICPIRSPFGIGFKFLNAATENTMELFDAVRSESAAASTTDAGKDLNLVLQILGTEPEETSDERRKFSRVPYVESATVELADPMGHQHRLRIHSRDANQWGVGFIAQVTLPVGQSALVQIKGGDGIDVRAVGCVVRCREVLPGWYEGALLFLDEQSSLAASAIAR
jgi:hypothetical protein